ncbi:MAG: MBL fold metallo-hydrolase [bacterium]|nr:MBL fold metallo-hydrolase [bacterium]
MSEVRYVASTDSWLRSRASASASARARQLLLGARVHIDPASATGGFVQAETVPDESGNVRSGFVIEDELVDESPLKVFYVDVGQGDAGLIEAEGALMIIDGGPHKGFLAELEARLAALQRAEEAIGRPAPQRLRINAVVVSHFDTDHYRGLTAVLNSPLFEFDRLFHNGLPRYSTVADKDLDLGTLHNGGTEISADLRGFSSAEELLNSGQLTTPAGNENEFAKFLRAALAARAQGRLGAMSRLGVRDPDQDPPTSSEFGGGATVEVLGPVTTTPTGAYRLPAFPNPHEPTGGASGSHTVNGNSVVLRLAYRDTSFLFGGDLNQPAHAYLAQRWGNLESFEVDVNKACHHGSADFDLRCLEDVAPLATVFSSGDEGGHDHPMPDAVGAAARYSRGVLPLVFSTELIRRHTSSGIRLGHVNARSNGETIVMAQKRERASSRTEWHTYPLPYPGPFGDHD